MAMHSTLVSALRTRSLVKVIAGIENFDRDHVLAIAKAAQAGGAQAVDVAADASIVRAVKAETDLVVFVSSVEASALAAAAEAGADVLEIGNFDAMYLRGEQPTAAEIRQVAEAVRTGAPETPLCVTVCGRLPLAEQVALATELEAMGVAILQTEGEVGPAAGIDTASQLTAAIAALANTAEIRKAVKLPLLLAGGLNVVSAPFAIAAGADAIGVGAAITKAADMVEATRALVSAVENVRRENAELAAR